MAAPRKPIKTSIPKRPPASTPEAREQQLIAAAFDLAEKQLAEGTASSQVITHLLKRGSTREREEQRKLAKETQLLSAKIESMASAARVEELYSAAISAMRVYSGQDSPEELELED